MRPTQRFLFAADLDGTLLPNTTLPAPAGCLARTQRLLAALQSHGCPTCFISGRHLDLARQGQREFDLPSPSYWVCNVGTEIYNRDGKLDEGWQQLLGPCFDHAAMWRLLSDIAAIRPQEDEKQGPHKFSLYGRGEADAVMQREIIARLAPLYGHLRLVVSLEEATGRGLIDVLPENAGKAQALHYLAEKGGYTTDRVFFAGDSGNDLDALASGVCGTLVGNAPPEVRRQAKMLMQMHPNARIHFARALYGDGVIEGLKAFGLLEEGP